MSDLESIIRTRLLGVKPDDQDIHLEDSDWLEILAALSIARKPGWADGFLAATYLFMNRRSDYEALRDAFLCGPPRLDINSIQSLYAFPSQDVRAAVIEECAKVADAQLYWVEDDPDEPTRDQRIRNRAVTQVATAIRALSPQASHDRI